MGAPELILTVDADRITITDRYDASCGCDRNITPKMGGEAECIRHGLQQYVLTRSAVIVVDGVAGWTHGEGCGRTSDGCEYTTVPPEQVRRLTEPCQTCDGAGWKPAITIDSERDALRCPDCRDGRQTFTLHQRCDHLIVKTLGLGDQCIRCLGEGVIDLGDGWVITAARPITEPYDDAGVDRVRLYPDGSATMMSGLIYKPWDLTDVTLPPAARPGMFAVFAEQVDR